MKKVILTRLFVIAAVCVTIMLLNPPCIFKKIFSVPCPGCGMTRAAHALMHFDLKSAAMQNAMIFLSPVIVWAIVTEGRMFRNEKVNKFILIFVMICAIIIYITNLIHWGYINVL